jgi:hypothetical protein
MTHQKNTEDNSGPFPPTLHAELNIPETTVKDYKAGQAKTYRLEQFKLGIEVLTLGAVIFYACIARYQWKALLVANEQTKTALHVSERAYLTTGNPVLDTDNGVVTMNIQNGGRIPSGRTDILVHEATVKQADTTKPPSVANVIEKHWKGMHSDFVAPGNSANLITRIPAFSKAELETGNLSIIIAIRMSYDDGFSDDPKQEWLYCVESVRHLILKQTFWTPCDARTILPVMEQLDGYPNNEQPYN